MQPAPELQRIVEGFYDAFSRADAAGIDALLSRQDGVLFIGTDPDEWWADYASLARAFKAQLQELSGARLQAGDPVAWREGSVGWAADRGTLHLPDGTALPFRLTAVFHAEGDAWKLVQGHTSFGVPNEEAVGKELPV